MNLFNRGDLENLLYNINQGTKVLCFSTGEKKLSQQHTQESKANQKLKYLTYTLFH